MNSIKSIHAFLRVLTKEAEESIEPIHSRMLFVFNREHYESWIREVLLPKKTPSLPHDEVDFKVNIPKNNDATLITAMNKLVSGKFKNYFKPLFKIVVFDPKNIVRNFSTICFN